MTSAMQILPMRIPKRPRLAAPLTLRFDPDVERWARTMARARKASFAEVVRGALRWAMEAEQARQQAQEQAERPARAGASA